MSNRWACATYNLMLDDIERGLLADISNSMRISAIAEAYRAGLISEKDAKHEINAIMISNHSEEDTR